MDYMLSNACQPMRYVNSSAACSRLVKLAQALMQMVAICAGVVTHQVGPPA